MAMKVIGEEIPLQLQGKSTIINTLLIGKKEEEEW